MSTDVGSAASAETQELSTIDMALEVMHGARLRHRSGKALLPEPRMAVGHRPGQ